LYKLRIEKGILGELKKYPPKIFKQLATKIFALSIDPRPQDARPLKDYSGGYRVDQGEYRILYTLDDREQLVSIFKVGHRKDVYRNL